MITVADLTADALGAFLASDFRRAFGSSHGQIAEALDASARIAIECIANSDALYHNLEHTMLVALAGHDILRGRGLREAIGPSDWAHFLVAYDPVAKWTVALVAGRATARCAAALLDKLNAEVPFRIEGIQVDGGSEFRAEFEDACRERNLCLFVLPPKRPQLNGHVERAQGSWRYESYGVEDLPSRLKPLQLRIDAFAHRFNHTRPHQALGDLTPAEYLSIISQEIAPSHMG